MTKLEFFFDTTSPWTYLAFTGLQPLAQRYAVDIVWRPILVGGVFNAVNQDLYAGREKMFANERRLTAMIKDLTDWANYRGISINWPAFHPASAVKVMRGCFVAAEQDLLLPYVRRAFEVYWGDQQDVSRQEVLVEMVTGLGMDSADFLQRIQQQDIKDQLRTTTEELIERGGYGSPTIFINDTDMYFGNDRLPLVEHTLQKLVSE